MFIFLDLIFNQVMSILIQQLIIEDACNFYTLYVWVCHIVGYIFVPIGNQLPV